MSDASSATPPPVVDLIDDGMTDEEIVAHTAAWRKQLESGPINELPESAAVAPALTAIEDGLDTLVGNGYFDTALDGSAGSPTIIVELADTGSGLEIQHTRVEMRD